jgi:hypothetical protein
MKEFLAFTQKNILRQKTQRDEKPGENKSNTENIFKDMNNNNNTKIDIIEDKFQKMTMFQV